MDALQQSELFAGGLARLGVRTEWRQAGDARVLVLRRFGLGLASRGDAGAAAVGPRLWNAERAEDAGPLRAADYRQIAAGPRIAELDLTPGAKALRAGLHPKWRNCLRPDGGRVVHEPFGIARHAWLLEAEAAQRRARRYRALPASLVGAMAAHSPGDVQVFVMGRDAGIVVLRHGRRGTYHLGWAGAAGRAANAHRTLLWAAMLWLAAEGVRIFDLGQVDPAAAPGLARFKTGTGAGIRALGGTWLKCRP